MEKSPQLSGWYQALFNIFVLWGINSVFLGFCSKILGANALLYTCTMFIAAAFVLLVYAGPGTLSRETLRSVDTWGYGFALLFGFLTLFELFSFVTAAEGALLQRLSIVASLTVGWFFLSKKMNGLKLLGAASVFTGIIWICSGVPAEYRVTVYSLVFLFAFIQAARILIAELHKPHTAAATKTQDPKAKCRVVGYVLFVVAILFLSISFVGALVYEYTGETIFAGMPHLSDFMRAENVLTGLLAGVFLAAPIRLIEFSSAQKIKADNFLAITCLGSFATLFWEWLTSPFTGLSLREFTQSDVMAGVLITLGGLIVALSNINKKGSFDALQSFLQYAPQELEQVSDSRDIVANALEHYDGDAKKAAKALDIPIEVINAMLADKEKVLAFRPDVLKKVARNYRHNIALSDALTGLSNRSGFMRSIKEEIGKNRVFTLLYIDLNKFKPINDTYGHQAGDEVLSITAERLVASSKSGSVVARLGGDEFAILLSDVKKAQALDIQQRLLQHMEEDIALEGGEIVNISASFGAATYPEDGADPEELLELADKGMYAQKKKNGR